MDQQLLQLWDSNPLWVVKNLERLTLGDGVDNIVLFKLSENVKKEGYTMRIYNLERKEKLENFMYKIVKTGD